MGGNTGDNFSTRPENINRKGRPPREHTLTNLLKETLNQTNDETGKTKKQEVIDKLYEIAVKDGDVQMLKYLVDRIDGKPLQQIQAEVTRPEIDMGKYTDEELDQIAELGLGRD